jgi:hypothetical protein
MNNINKENMQKVGRQQNKCARRGKYARNDCLNK